MELKPCPFCGSDEIITSNWGLWRCWCSKCLAKTADMIREKDAVKAWNKRKDDVDTVNCGRWEEWWPPKHMILTGEEMLYRCSACDAKYSDKENMRYCPNCGAKMDLEGKSD